MSFYREKPRVWDWSPGSETITAGSIIHRGRHEFTTIGIIRVAELSEREWASALAQPCVQRMMSIADVPIGFAARIADTLVYVTART